MRGFDGAFLICAAVLLVAAGASNADELGRGRTIYQDGIGSDPITLSVYGEKLTSRENLFTCASCHGDYGTGGSEGGVVAPALTSASSMEPSGARAWLTAALSGQSSSDAMPRYSLSAGDLDALTAYVLRLPDPPIPGLTPTGITVAVDMTGSGLTSAEHALLIEELQALSGSLGDQGLFGRRVNFVQSDTVSTAEPAFAEIAWDASQVGQAPVRLSVRAPGPAASDDVCASYQPPVAEQYRALVTLLDKRGQSYAASWEGAAPPADLPELAHYTSPSRPDARIYIGLPASMPPERETWYVFADLIGAAASDPRIAGAHLLIPIPVDGQISGVRKLMARSPIDAGAAGVIVATRAAAAALLTAFAGEGRRLSRRALCERLDKAFRQNWSLYELTGDDARPLDVRF